MVEVCGLVRLLDRCRCRARSRGWCRSRCWWCERVRNIGGQAWDIRQLNVGDQVLLNGPENPAANKPQNSDDGGNNTECRAGVHALIARLLVLAGLILIGLLVFVGWILVGLIVALRGDHNLCGGRCWSRVLCRSRSAGFSCGCLIVVCGCGGGCGSGGICCWGCRLSVSNSGGCAQA